MAVGNADDFDQLDTSVPNVNTQGKEILDNYQREIRRIWKINYDKEHNNDTGVHNFPIVVNPTAEVLDPINGSLAFDSQKGKIFQFDSSWKVARLHQDQALSLIGLAGPENLFDDTTTPADARTNAMVYPFADSLQASSFKLLARADVYFQPGQYLFHAAAFIKRIAATTGIGVTSMASTIVRLLVDGFALLVTPAVGTPNSEAIYSSNVNFPAGLEMGFGTAGFHTLSIEGMNNVAGNRFGVQAASCRWQKI